VGEHQRARPSQVLVGDRHNLDVDFGPVETDDPFLQSWSPPPLLLKSPDALFHHGLILGSDAVHHRAPQERLPARGAEQSHGCRVRVGDDPLRMDEDGILGMLEHSQKSLVALAKDPLHPPPLLVVLEGAQSGDDPLAHLMEQQAFFLIVRQPGEELHDKGALTPTRAIQTTHEGGPTSRRVIQPAARAFLLNVSHHQHVRLPQGPLAAQRPFTGLQLSP